MDDYSARLCISSVICSFVTAPITFVNGQDMKPFGPRMCEELCNRVSGCSSFRTEFADLSCRVDVPVNTTRSSKDAVLLGDQLQISFRGGVLSCPSQFIMTVLTSRKHLKCVNYCVMKEYDVTQKTRLLIVKLHAGYDQGFPQLFLGNGSFHTHPVVKARFISAITVVQKSRKLLIAANEGIMSVPVDSSKVTVIQDRIKVRSMVVDEERDILFVTYQRNVKKMTLTGKNIQTVFAFNSGFYPQTIVLDPSNNVIFVQSFYKILSVTYEGKNTQMLVEGMGIHNLLFDPDRSLLYYSKWTELFSFSLSMNIKTVLMSLSFRPKSIVFFNNVFYIYGNNDELGVVRGSKYEKIQKIFSTPQKGVKMCFIR